MNPSTKTIISVTLVIVAFSVSCTQILIGTQDGTVIARRAQIRSSFAVVAADLLEVKRGDRLLILDESEYDGVRWYRVRAYDEDETEGWIEAQNVLTDEVLDKSRKIAEGDQGRSPQAIGQLRARSNLRLEPKLDDGNILFKLDGDTVFEILSWLYVPREKGASDIDDGRVASRDDAGNESAAGAERLDTSYDVWYKVRLDPKFSPAPAGWLFGRQVSFVIPNDIIFFQQENRRFVGWQRLDGRVITDNSEIVPPGSYVIITQSGVSKNIKGDQPDFDAITVLAYDDVTQKHTIAYRSSTNLWGKTPLEIEGTGNSRTFTVNLMNFKTGELEKRKFSVLRDDRRMTVTAPADMKTFEKRF